jgi:GDP-L-fucose synthase
MKILITGATGFLGKELCKQLKFKGHDIFPIGSKDCDLTNANEMKQIANEKFDQIFHLAAFFQSGDYFLKNPGEQWINNQLINTNILVWWKYQQPKAKMIAIGTSCSYDPSFPLKETNFLEGKPIEGLFTYAYTKRMLYSGLLSLNKQYGMKYLFPVPSTLYGENYFVEDNRKMHFIFDLIRKILNFKYGKRVKIKLWGDGYQKREIVHVKDFVSILLKINDKIENDIVNIGSGKEYSIRDFAKIICDIVGVNNSVIIYDKNKFSGIRKKILNIDKMKEIIYNLYIEKKVNLIENLRKTINWMKMNKKY